MTYDTINDAVTRAGGAGALLIGRYRIVRPLGQGGMGSVWLAEDTQLDNKPFAIKMLPSILANNKRAYAQLKKEALVAMDLSHTNIVTVRAFEENDGNPFLVMDYIDGQTLDDYLAEKGKLSEDDVLRVLRPIAAALDYAHTKGVIHRDVKPGNVMIAKDGTPYILDFGIAREIQETMTRVTGKLSSGTLLYMSPEQLMGEDPSAAQDVYSFAAMAYECLKGKPPFTHGQIEFQIMNKPADPLPTEGLTGNAAILAAGVMAGLAKKPKDRPATCASVLEGRATPQGGGTQVGDTGRARSPSGPQPDTPRPPQPKVACHDHKGVQLWEGGPYWAETNIGAEKPEDYGYYFWWGDTVGYKRENGVWVEGDGASSGFSFEETNLFRKLFGKKDNIPTCGKDFSTLLNDGWITAEGVLAPEHDAAHVQWGGGWRMPTKLELGDLVSKCDWKWTAVNGVNGYEVRGKGAYASESIFLPCAGRGCGTSLGISGSRGGYWSSVPRSDNSGSWGLYFNSSYLYTSYYGRDLGFSVRPVQGFTK